MGRRFMRFIRFIRFGERTSDDDDDSKELTVEELSELKTAWEVCRESSNVGEEVMLKLVHKRPQFAYFFGMDNQRPNDHTSVALQGARIEKFFDTVFLALTQTSEDAEDVVTEQCRRVGSIHCCRGVNLADDDLYEFSQIIIEVIMDHQKRCESKNDDIKMREHWKQLLTKLIVEVKVGYEKESLVISAEAPRFSYTKPKRVRRTPTFRRRHLSVPLNVNIDGEQLHFNLNPLELEAVQMSWQAVSLNKEVGIELILRMIVDKPCYGTSLGIEMTKEVAELWVDQTVRIQGHRIHLFFDTMVNLYNTETLDNLKHLCHRVGAVHFNKNVNFTADVWILLKREIIEIVTNTVMGDLNSPGSQRKNNFKVGAWDKLMRWIIKEMKKGFLEEAHKSGTNK